MRTGGARRSLAGALVAALMVVAVGCTSGSADEGPERADPPTSTSTSTTSTTTSTTSTTLPEPTHFEPLVVDPDQSVKEQVEAAYLHHWDVLMDAFASGNGDSLDVVYVDEALEERRRELAELIDGGFRVGGHVEHNYAITVLEDDSAIVMDGYRNYLVRVDPVSGEPLGEASGEEVLHEYQLRKVEGRWLVFDTFRHSLPE